MADGNLRWGLLSTARINERIIPGMRAARRSELLAVSSRDQAKAEAYAVEWEIPRAYGSYEAMLADPDVDVVYISLPNSMHEEWTIKCAEAGKHVLCEKPLAIRPEEVDRMAEAASRYGVVVQEATMMRFHQQTLDVKKLLAEGAIGDVRVIQSTFSYLLTRTVDIRLEPKMGGGALWDLGSYQASFSRSMVGAEPVEVLGWEVPHETGVDRSFFGHLRFASGVVSQFFCSLKSAPTWHAELIGLEGIMRLDLPYQNHPGGDGHVRIFRGSVAGEASTFGDSSGQLVEETLTYEDCDAYRDQVDTMAAIILDGAETPLPLHDSRANVATIVALYQSAREGRPVSL